MWEPRINGLGKIHGKINLDFPTIQIFPDRKVGNLENHRKPSSIVGSMDWGKSSGNHGFSHEDHGGVPVMFP